MEAFVMGVQRIELVGGESWWTHNAGSFFIGLAAIVAAGLAAYISIRNHQQQLAHDREIRDRDATRSAIDAAVAGIADGILKTATLSGHVKVTEPAREKFQQVDQGAPEVKSTLEKEINTAEAKLNKAIPPAYGAVNTMHADTIRLAIRLGNDHPVTAAHRKTREALDHWQAALDKGFLQNRTTSEKEVTEDKLSELSQARGRFESACYTWLNG